MKTEQSAGDDLPHEAGFPRRFGIGTLLVVTTMFGVLFAGLQALGCPPIVFFLALLFFTAVGLGQAFLFGGKHPRRASVIVGAVFVAGWFFLVVLLLQPYRRLYCLVTIWIRDRVHFGSDGRLCRWGAGRKRISVYRHGEASASHAPSQTS